MDDKTSVISTLNTMDGEKVDTTTIPYKTSKLGIFDTLEGTGTNTYIRDRDIKSKAN